MNKRSNFILALFAIVAFCGCSNPVESTGLTTKVIPLSESSRSQSSNSVFITEISDSANYNCEFIEIYNSSNLDIDLSGWKLEEDRGNSTSSTSATSLYLNGIIKSKNFLIISRNISKEGFQNGFNINLDPSTNFLNSNNKLIINKSYQRFILMGSNGIVDNSSKSFLRNKGKVAVRNDFTLFNESSFNFEPVSSATPGELTPLQIELFGNTITPDEPTPTDPETEKYYSSANGLTGNSLKAELNRIIKKHKTFSYSDAWKALIETDEDPNNPSNFILIYTGRSIPKTSTYPLWNREHVWAKSHGNFGTSNGPGTDLHHLRPADVSVNSTRGNKDFDIGGMEDKEAAGNFTDNDSWEPRDEVKGDIARMIFYMAVRYEGNDGYVDLEITEGVNSSPNKEPLHGNLSVLKSWNELDPVSDMEKARNDEIYINWQGNRNPFIDHPEWVNLIW